MTLRDDEDINDLNDLNKYFYVSIVEDLMLGDEKATDDYSRYGADKDIECIDAIRQALTADEFRGYCKGNAFKYLWRERQKGHDVDLAKAEDYIHQAAHGEWAHDEGASDGK